jgi:hypothetical protein
MCVVLVAWNKPPYRPIPLSKQIINKPNIANHEE